MAEEKNYPGAYGIRDSLSGKRLIEFYDADGRPHQIDRNEWEVQLKLTRKVKPIPNGTRATWRSANGAFFAKRGGVWRYYLYSGDFDAAVATHQDDEWYRKYTKPLVVGEWD